MQKTLLGIFFLIASPVYAQVTTVVTPPPTIDTTQTIQWVSKDSNDSVTIANGTGLNLTIQIAVNPSADTKIGGIDIKNCGDTKHVEAGSSAICATNDATNPVTFASDSGTEAASGTYTVKQK